MSKVGLCFHCWQPKFYILTRPTFLYVSVRKTSRRS